MTRRTVTIDEESFGLAARGKGLWHFEFGLGTIGSLLRKRNAVCEIIGQLGKESDKL